MISALNAYSVTGKADKDFSESVRKRAKNIPWVKPA
jgi:hypothetical protein